MGGMISIPGQQIVLRDWRLADLERHAFWLQPGHRWKELDAPYVPGPVPEAIPAIIGLQRAAILAGNLPIPRTSLVLAARRNDELLGLVNWYYEEDEERWPQFGIAIYDPACWQRGYGYEAASLWCDHLFLMLPDLPRLDLRTWAGNPGALRIAAKLGFREDRRRRRTIVHAGQSYETRCFFILRTQWDARSRVAGG